MLGFALCTDDDVSALLPTACTARLATSSNLADLLFTPCDWQDLPIRTPDSLERVVDAFLDRPVNDWSAREAHFQVLVDGLAAARASAQLDAGVFLSVLSTDPCEPMSRLEENALPRLNGPDIVRRWNQWRVEGAQARLLKLQATPSPHSYEVQDSIGLLRAEVQRLRALLDS
ncbi:MAG: hypothetical protein QM756_07790 [Polyangiaceae bacterium]